MLETKNSQLLDKVDKIKSQLEVTLQGTLTPESFELIMQICYQTAWNQCFDIYEDYNKRRLEAYRQADWKKYEICFFESQSTLTRIRRGILKEIRVHLNIDKMNFKLSEKQASEDKEIQHRLTQYE